MQDKMFLARTTSWNKLRNGIFLNSMLDATDSS